MSFEPEVVVDEDFCDSALDLWLDNGSNEIVFEAMGDAETHDALFAAIEGGILTEIAAQEANLPDDVTLGTVSLTQLACPSATCTRMWIACSTAATG